MFLHVFIQSLLLALLVRVVASISFNLNREINQSNVFNKTEEFVSMGGGGTGIPPKPNITLTLTATPDPYETSDPTTQAKVILRSDLFSHDNGRVIYYALLIAQETYSQPPENGSWNSTQPWPPIGNWEWQNTSYQVTPIKWNPFENKVSTFQDDLKFASYILGDNGCEDGYYCNKPLQEKTKYALKIRAFTHTGYQDTDAICFETLEKLPVSRLVSVLGGLFAATAAAVCFSIYDFECIKKLRLISDRKMKNSVSPIPEPLSHKCFLKYAKDLLNMPGRLGNEFHLLGTLSSDVSTLCLHAQRVDNRDKNRYGNILPFDMTRVQLSVIDGNPSTDYINASFIKGYSQKVEYIASQGPKEETCYDFYRMILEQKTELIIMLTELYEKGVEKCYKYFPDEGQTLKVKDITVVSKSVSDLEFCVKRVFRIIKDEKIVIEVTQLHFKNWYDFDSPKDTEVMLKFCDLVEKASRTGYTLVHCSAGTGRTGTFIAIDILLRSVRNNNKISVFNTVLKLRQQRVNMVQTEAQLRYIYQCLYCAVERSLAGSREIV